MNSHVHPIFADVLNRAGGYPPGVSARDLGEAFIDCAFDRRLKAMDEREDASVEASVDRANAKERLNDLNAEIRRLYERFNAAVCERDAILERVNATKVGNYVDEVLDALNLATAVEMVEEAEREKYDAENVPERFDGGPL